MMNLRMLLYLSEKMLKVFVKDLHFLSETHSFTDPYI